MKTTGPAGPSSGGWRNKALAVAAVLLVVNIWLTLTNEVGPDPEIEALHSEEEAVLLCRRAVDSELAARNPSPLDPGRPEYLQGGEYDVRFEVELRDGTRRVRETVRCQVQFTVGSGWTVEDVSVE